MAGGSDGSHCLARDATRGDPLEAEDPVLERTMHSIEHDPAALPPDEVDG